MYSKSYSKSRTYSNRKGFLAAGLCLLAGAANAIPTVSGTTISWPDDGWYQVQTADGSMTLCSGGDSCDVDPGTYLVINHSTGERFDDVTVTGSSDPAPASDGVSVSGTTISWPDDGWYQVQSADGSINLCSGGLSCEVSEGTYLVINHTTGERFSDIIVDGSLTPANPPTNDGVSVSGTTISWPADGWYQVQTADGTVNVCDGGSFCEVSPGTYVVINHTTGERFTDIEVGGSTTPVTPPEGVDSVTVSGNTISWPDNGWYQVQNATTFETLCEGGTSCEVPSSGTYIVINHSSGTRETVIVGDDGTPPVSDATVAVNFEIEVPFYVSNALQVRVLWGDVSLTAAWLTGESWSVTGNFAVETEHALSVVFSDDNGGTTLASFDTSYRTGSQDSEVIRVTADQFDSESWDSDGDGTSNLTELLIGHDPFVIDTVSPTAPRAPVALNILTYSGYDVELFWPRASDDVAVVGYDIVRNGDLLATMLDTLSYYDSTTEPEHEYIYTVYAVDNDGFRSAPTSATTITPADQPASGIETQYATLTGSSENTATWSISDGLTTTNGSPTGGSCTSRDGAGSGVGISDATLQEISGSTQGDAFDNASLLWINGAQVGGFLRAATSTTSNFATVPVSGLEVTVQYHAVSTSATLRHYTTLRNDTANDIFAVVNFTSNFGSDSNTRIVSTSSDDTNFGENDRWVVTNDSSAIGGDPANTTVFYGPGSVSSPVVFAEETAFDCASSDGLNARIDVIVPARSQRALLFFHHLSTSDFNAEFETLLFETTPSVGSALVEGLTQEQLSEIVNWDF